jgi:hypothetical protein
MAIPSVHLRRLAAIILFAILTSLAVVSARYESLAALSPRKRSDIALLHAVSTDMNALELRRYAHHIARDDPMHAIGFFLELLALDKDKTPLSAKHRYLIAEAARRQPSLAAPRIWLTADDIRKGRYAEAIDGADAVMRLNGEFRKLLIPILVPLLAEEKARTLLEKKLEEFPIWRTGFIVEAVKAGEFDREIERILQHQVPQYGAASIAAERSVYLRNLVERGEGERALRLWQGYFPKGGNKGVADGNFADKYPLHPFAWQLASDDYSFSEKVPATEGSPSMVRAHHSGDRKAALLTQLVALKPGTHELVFTMRDGGLGEPEAMYWRLRCIGSSENLVSRSLAKLGPDWQKLRIKVTVPDSGCAMQHLLLEAKNNDDEESEIEIRSVEAK